LIKERNSQSELKRFAKMSFETRNLLEKISEISFQILVEVVLSKIMIF
jgi:hypothetical protein